MKRQHLLCARRRLVDKTLPTTKQKPGRHVGANDFIFACLTARLLMQWALAASEPNKVYALNPETHKSFVQHFNFTAMESIAFDTCAVVGSSSTLLKHRDGSRIDGYSAVIRANSYPITRDDFAFTGSKTSLVVSTFPSSMQHEAVVFYCNTRWVGICWHSTRRDGRPRLSPALVTRVRQRYGVTRWPSTGLMAIALAQVLCKNISTFGFGIDRTFSNCSHFYNTRKDDVRNCTLPNKTMFRNSQSRYSDYLEIKWHNMKKEASLIQQHMPHMDLWSTSLF